MRITKKYMVISAVSLAMIGAGVAIVGNGPLGLAADGENEHSASCAWRHYEEVAPTYERHGSKEFWACCSHPGKYSFVAPSEGSVSDEGAFSGIYFDALQEGDPRYMPSLYEGAVNIYDAKEKILVPQNYTPKSFETSAGHLDSTIGAYSTLDIKEASDDWVWFKVAEDDQKKDLSSYSSVFFYMRSNQDVNGLQIYSNDWKASITGLSLKANAWTKITVPVSDIYDTLIDIAPALYVKDSAVADLVWDFSSFYGIEKAANPFEGMTTLYDTQYNYYVPESYTPASLVGKDPISAKGNLDSKYGYYCRIDIEDQTNCDAIWFRPAPKTSLSGYSKVVYYIRSNVLIDNFKVNSMGWKNLLGDGTLMTLSPNVWTKVEVDVSGDASLTLQDISMVSWDHHTNVVWDVTSIYGVK